MAVVELEQLLAPAERQEVQNVMVQLRCHSVPCHILLQKGQPLPLLTTASGCGTLHCLLLLKLDSLPLPIAHAPSNPILTLSNAVGNGEDDNKDNYDPASCIRAAKWSSSCSMQRDCHLSQVYMGAMIPTSSQDNWRVRRRDLMMEAHHNSVTGSTLTSTSTSAPLRTTIHSSPTPTTTPRHLGDG